MTVHDYLAGDGPPNLVSNAIPLKPGALLSEQYFRVLDGGTELSIAAVALARWPHDNSIRSLLVQFNAPFSGSTKDFVFEIGTVRGTSDLQTAAVTWDLPGRIFTMPASYLSDSLFVWEQKPLGETEFPAWETKQLSSFGSIATVGSEPCARDDQYYNAIHTSYQLYARTGDIDYLVAGRQWALHHGRDQIHLTGSNVGRPKCSDNTKTRYTYPQGLVDDYFMFGDEASKAVAGLVVDNFYMPHSEAWYYKAAGERGFWTEREAAFSLIGILSCYEATNGTSYLDKVADRVHSLHQMQVENGNRAWVHNLYDHDPSEGCSPSDWGSSPWMSGLLLEAIIKYHKLTGDPLAREAILMAVDDLMASYLATGDYAGQSFIYLGCPPTYSDGVPDLDNVVAHAFGYAYRLSGFTNQNYLNLGTAVFNTAVAEGYAGTHKHFNQQFRSSGHFVAYIQTDDFGAPTANSVLPSSGGGPGALFSYEVSDPDGYQDIGWMYVIFNGTWTTINSCPVWYAPLADELYLADDAGNWLGPMSPGAAGTLQNSQCTLDIESSSVVKAGTDITLNLDLTFHQSGTRTTWLYGADLQFHTTGWVPLGTWTVTGSCSPDLAFANETLTGTQTLEAATSVTLGPNLIVDGTDIVVNAPTVTILGDTEIRGVFSVGNNPSCP